MRNTNVLDPLTKRGPHFFKECLVLICSLLGLLLFRLILKLAQIQPTLRNRLQGFTIELGQMADDPFIDTVGQEQYLDTFLLENLKVRTIAGRIEAVGRNVVNLFLALFHAADVVGQGNGLLLAITLS